MDTPLTPCLLFVETEGRERERGGVESLKTFDFF